MPNMHTYTNTVGGRGIYTRTVDEQAGTSVTYWHPNARHGGRTTFERAVPFGQTHDGETTYVWEKVEA
jgi:hypothetical protein